MVSGLPARYSYRSLRLIARLHIVVHTLILVVGGGGVIVGTVLTAPHGLGLAIGILFGGGAAVMLVLLYSLAEAAIILLALQIEEHTRLTAHAAAHRSDAAPVIDGEDRPAVAPESRALRG